MRWSYKLINCLWLLIVHTTGAAIIGPDTLSVNRDTFYMYGYEYPTKQKLTKGWAYSHLTPQNLEPLAQLEWNIYHEVANIYGKLNGSIPIGDKFAMNVKEYLEDFEATSLQLVNRMKNESKNTSREYILTTNLLTPFLTVRRFRNYIRPWIERASSSATTLQDSILRYISSVYKAKGGPFRLDFHYSMFAIIMPHLILDLKAQDIANGLIRGKEIGVKLKACHCLDIGVHGVVSGMYPIGIEWLELTMDKINNGDDSVDLEFARNWLEAAIRKHDDMWEPAGLLEYASVGSQFFEKPLKLMKSGEDRKWQKQKVCEDKENLPNVLSKTNSLPAHLHWSLCKGDVEQSVSEKSQLFCWYEKAVNAIFEIGPLKAELLSAHPRLELVQFHDLVSNESFFNAIKSSIRLHESTFEHDLPKLKHNYGAINNLKNPEALRKVLLLAERLTGLRGYRATTYATSYVPGGFVNTHEDWEGFGESHKTFLVRLATFFLYIEQPEQGGETTFPVSLAKPTPFKGSALFSYDLLRSGAKDKYAPHASCPMTFGRKWVVSKDWYYVDQTHLTCSPDREEKHEILVNGKTKYRNKILQRP